MSGEALTRTQEASSLPETAIEDWVRARARKVPARYPAQFAQLQFHWGNPPPAADPSTRIFTKKRAPPAYADERPFALSAIRHVHGDFHAIPHFYRLRGFPTHNESPGKATKLYSAGIKTLRISSIMNLDS